MTEPIMTVTQTHKAVLVEFLKYQNRFGPIQLCDQLLQLLDKKLFNSAELKEIKTLFLKLITSLEKHCMISSQQVVFIKEHLLSFLDYQHVYLEPVHLNPQVYMKKEKASNKVLSKTLKIESKGEMEGLTDKGTISLF
jgi:hypothetical protein